MNTTYVEPVYEDPEQLHRVVLSNISDAVFITDDAGHFTFICPNVNVIFGYEPDEVAQMVTIDRLLGKGWYDPRQLAHRGEILNIERELRDKDGRAHIVLINIKRVAIKDGTRLYTCRDVTDRKVAEEALSQYQERLSQAARLSTLGEMASGLAHELNQPLSAISNFTQACIRRIKSGRCVPDDLLGYLEQVGSQTHRAGEIVRRVRRFVKPQPGHSEHVDALTLIRDVLALTEPGARRVGVPIELRIARDLPELHVDAVGVQQVLINLITNAVEVMAVEGAEMRPVVLTARHGRHGGVEFLVRDYGPGLTEEQVEQVFEPFYTTKSGGMGLGLAISRSIVESHGGQLWAKTNPDDGATFGFSLAAARGGVSRRKGNGANHGE